MPAGSRLTISAIGPDPRASAISSAAEAIGLHLPGPVAVSDIAFVEGGLGPDELGRLGSFLADPLLQTATWDEPGDHDNAWEIAFHPGVTDSFADAIRQAGRQLGVRVSGSATGRRVVFPDGTDEATVDALLRRVIANPVIERWSRHRIQPVFRPGSTATGAAAVIAIRELDDDALAALDAERSMALDPAELAAIREHFRAAGRDPTDVELETLAQTWSEHCAHKTFRASITDQHGSEIAPLLRQLRDATDRIGAKFVRSAFVGNAGIVSFVDGVSLALKAETHNHPSAVEPFGGANTGVGGVIRDVMGIGHRPIALTDVLCFGPADTDPADVPEGTLHPRRIRQGVIDGVADYGNKIGLPTVAGAVLYDPDYTANPLVFCGCIGVADDPGLGAAQETGLGGAQQTGVGAAQETGLGGAQETGPGGAHDPGLGGALGASLGGARETGPGAAQEPWAAPGPFPGDRVVVLGGRTGRDGIRGATFSSATMDATTGEVAGASVQIGDPVTEKLLIDVLDGAHHLWSAITDCGAGGLSSAVGEMAERVGADVELDRVPLKYAGLEPWEIWLSEAQERMVLAVPPTATDELQERCARHRVGYADIGEFTGDGRLVVRSGGTPVLDLATAFLHDGRPQRSMTATVPTPNPDWTGRNVHDPGITLLELLAYPTIASKADVVHRYDHEIGGNTAVRPLVGAGDVGHADGVVIARPDDERGFAVGVGVNPWHGLHDPKAMAAVAVDEAIRNVVAVGADPDQVALLDNFSWGDPRDPETLGGLAAAVAGCCEAALAFGAPFVSGKDSLNNTYVGCDGARHAVPPTLVVTAVAHVPDVDACVTPELRAAGNVLVLLGDTAPHFAGSHLDVLTGAHRNASPDAGRAPQFDPAAPARYRGLHEAIRRRLVQSCHDVSEGGVAVAVAEMCIASGLGARVDTLPHDDVTTALFAESAGRLVVEVREADVDVVLRLAGGGRRIGRVTTEPVLELAGAAIGVDRLRAAFHGAAR